MGVTKADMDSVAYGLHTLRQSLDKLSYSTFPNGDEEKQRFLDVVRECEQMLWGVSGGIPFRYTRTWGQTARLMQAKMQPLLHEVCALQCSHIWYCEDIHRIAGLVDGICAWQEEAVAAQAEEEAAWGTALGTLFKAAQAKKAAMAVVMSRAVEAFKTVTVVAGKETPPTVIILTTERREALRQVVKEMRINIFTLKEDVKGYHPDKLASIESVVEYQESCCGDNTWVWDAEAWGAAIRDLKSCRDYWRRYAQQNASFTNFKRLSGECDTCMHDMAKYKLICDNGTEKDSTSFAARVKRVLGLTVKLPLGSPLDDAG
jgi:hypothetical protein